MNAHPDLQRLIDGASMPAAERRELLSHLRVCPACRAELATTDRSLLFSLLALEPVPDGVLERVSERAMAAIDRETNRRAARRGYVWRSLAASLLVAALAGAYFFDQEAPEAPPPSPTGVAESVEPPATDAVIPTGMIELLDSPGSADVVEMLVGDLEVAMIFDEAMKI